MTKKSDSESPHSHSIDQRILDIASKVTGKRAKIVINHIIKFGSITTEDINRYGYEHPPRAVRDVRESGIPLEKSTVTNRDGKKIAEYRFGDPSQIDKGKLGGRSVLPKKLAQDLYKILEGKCSVCNHGYEMRYLQIDHRVPYEIAGEPTGELNQQNYMLLCASCQRKKSWSCEHCKNWAEKIIQSCVGCFWVSPENYQHIALEQIRRVDLVFSKEEISIYNKIGKSAKENNIQISQEIKNILKEKID